MAKTYMKMTPEQLAELKLTCYREGHRDGWNAYRDTLKNLVNHDHTFSCDDKPEKLPEDLQVLFP